MSRATRVIDYLSTRGGFDGWWDEIDEETQADILQGLEATLADTVTELCWPCYMEVGGEMLTDPGEIGGRCDRCGQDRSLTKVRLHNRKD